MPTTYIEADRDAQKLLEDLIHEHRQDLVDADANVTFLFAHGTLNKFGIRKPAMKARGHHVLGKCKINSLADRAEGKGDATITVDGDHWDRWSPKQRLAVLHHELSHIAVWGGKTDADDRPKLKIQHADFDFDGFHAVIDTYGADAVEAVNLKRVIEDHRQLFLPFAEDPAGAVTVTIAAAPAPKPARTRKPAKDLSGEQIAARSRR